MSGSRGALEIEWSTSPLPPSVALPPGFVFELGSEWQVAEEARAAEWKRRAEGLGVALPDAPAELADRVREQCLVAGERVFVKACVSADARSFEKCAEESPYV